MEGRFGFIPENRGFYGDDWRLIAELHIAYADGTEQVVFTGEGWQLGRSNTYASSIYDGECVDDTLPVEAPVPASLLDSGAAAEATAKLHDRLCRQAVVTEGEWMREGVSHRDAHSLGRDLLGDGLHPALVAFACGDRLHGVLHEVAQHRAQVDLRHRRLLG